MNLFRQRYRTFRYCRAALSVHRDVDAGFVLRIHLAPFDKVKGLKVETTPAVLRWLAFWFGDP